MDNMTCDLDYIRDNVAIIMKRIRVYWSILWGNGLGANFLYNKQNNENNICNLEASKWCSFTLSDIEVLLVSIEVCMLVIRFNVKVTDDEGMFWEIG